MLVDQRLVQSCCSWTDCLNISLIMGWSIVKVVTTPLFENFLSSFQAVIDNGEV